MASDVLLIIKDRLASGNTQLAIENLSEYVSPSDSDSHDELTLLKARWNRLQRKRRLGVITEEEYNAQLASVDRAVMDFARSLPSVIDGVTSPRVSSLSTISLPTDTALEKVIGIDNLKQIEWLRQGIIVASGVCRIITPHGFGTGFQIAPGLLMTNCHVIGSQSTAREAIGEFNFESDSFGATDTTHRYRLDPDRYISSPVDELDYTIVGIIEDSQLPPISQWAQLRFASGTFPIPGDHVSIIQHPQGGPKKIALTANQVVGSDTKYLYYTTDTMKGSSGSPVLNDRWEVIGLHHAYGGTMTDRKGNLRHVNEGILIEEIMNHADSFLRSESA